MENVNIEKKYLEFLQTSVPDFWRMKTALKRLDTVKLLPEFFMHLFKHYKISHSQLYQDLFVDFVYKSQKNLKFLEFGATNGVELSNSLMLESERGWSGLLAEPDPQWHDALIKNRKNTSITFECIFSESNKVMKFLSSHEGVFSSLKDFSQEDANGPLAGNAKVRMQSYEEIDVKTISLNDVHEKFFDARPIDYISVDTEGSELEILKSFNFEKYGPGVFTIEHNFTANQPLIDELLQQNDYVRIFAELSVFDAWYVRKDIANSRGFI